MVLAVIFYTMSPETNNGMSTFSEATFIILAIFFVVTIARILMAARRKNK